MVMKIFTIERIVGDISLEIVFSTVVGTGLRSQYQMIEIVNCLFRVRKREGKWSRGGGRGNDVFSLDWNCSTDVEVLIKSGRLFQTN